MRTEYRLKLQSECFAIDKLQLLENEYSDALKNLEKKEISFSLLSDVCLPVSLLLLILIWGYQMNATSVDEEDNTMLLIYGIGLIVVTGCACVYVAIRMAVMQPVTVTTILPGEFQLKPYPTKQRRSQRLYYQTIPEIHRAGKKSTGIFIV